MSRLRILTSALVIPALALTAAGCGGSSSPSPKDQKPASGGTFTMLFSSDPGSLDPSMTPSTVGRTMLSLSYDTLMYPKEDGSYASGLAAKWSSTPTTATFTLKPGITCSDGSKLTATDVADNINYLANPKNASPLTGVLVNPGTKAKGTDGSRTVKVTSAGPDGFLMDNLSGVYIICGAGLKNHKSLTSKTNGTGPWTLKGAVPGDHYTFSKHAGYAWGPDGQDLAAPGVPDTVSVKVVNSATTTANLLMSGEANRADVSGPDAQRLDKAGLKTVDSVLTSGETWFNHAKGHPGSDPAVREALSLGANREQLMKVTTNNKGMASKGLVTLLPNPCAGTDTIKGLLPGYDPTKADQVLEAAGWKKGTNGIRAKGGQQLAITLIYDARGQSTRTAGAELLAEQWKEIGVKTKLQNLPQAQLNNAFFKTGAWDVAWSGWTFNLPSQMVGFVSGATPSKGGGNFSDIQNPAYSKAAAQAVGEVGTKSCATWAKAEQALVKNHDIVPMFDEPNRTYLQNATDTEVGGQIWGTSLRLLKG